MPISAYLAALREHIGHDLVLLPSAAAVVVDDAGRILLEQRADNHCWTLPAGAVDPGEQPAEAALREIEEETGVHAAIDRLAGVAMHPTRYPNGDRCEYLNVWFRAHPIGGTARVNDDESLAVDWFAADDLPELKSWERLRIETALRDDPMPWFARPGEDHDALSTSDVV